MKKNITIIIVIVIILIIGVGCKRKVSNQKFDEIQQEKEEGNIDNVAKETAKLGIKVRDEITVINQIHEMANTIVIASQKWGKEKITKEEVNALILEVEISEYESKDKLLEILYRWENGNFRMGDTDHNLVWNLLNGTIGLATGLDLDEIKKLEEEWQNK